MSEKTVQEVQAEIEAALAGLPQFESQLPANLKPLLRLAPPRGTRAQVSFLKGKKGRQVRRSAAMDKWWSAKTGTVSIGYDTLPLAAAQTEAGRTPPETAGQIDTSQGRSKSVVSHVPVGFGNDQPTKPTLPGSQKAEDRLGDLVRALAIAERDQPSFVALKWFRDSFLPYQGFDWAAVPESRHHALREAISRNWIGTMKIPNPRNPQFPVTAIRINRLLSDVRSALDQAGAGSLFMPVSISGEPLSSTVLRERR
jgi:hypothetical protein